MDDSVLQRLRLEEELQASNLDADPSGWGSFNLDMSLALGLEPAGEEKEKPKAAKLAEFPILEEERLRECIKKFKDAALKRKGTIQSTKDRLKEDAATGYEWPGYSSVYAVRVYPRLLLSDSASSLLLSALQSLQIFRWKPKPKP